MPRAAASAPAATSSRSREAAAATRARPRPSSSPNTASTICCSLIPSRRSRSWTGSPWAAGSASRCRATSGSRPRIRASPCPRPRIGLFPDVGGGWYLPRLPGRVGQFMVLTGARLDGAECHYLRLATHYAEHGAIEDLVEPDPQGSGPGRGRAGRRRRNRPAAPRSRRICPRSRGCSRPTGWRRSSPRSSAERRRMGRRPSS